MKILSGRDSLIYHNFLINAIRDNISWETRWDVDVLLKTRIKRITEDNVAHMIYNDLFFKFDNFK